MNIVQTNKAYHPKVGGIETTITTLSEGLVANYNVSVFSLICNDRISLKTIEKNIKGVQVKYLPTYGFIASLPLSPGYFKSLSSLSGDVLHIHEPFPLADLALHFLPKIRKRFERIVVSWHSDIVRQKWVLSFYGKYIHDFLRIVDRIIVSNPNIIQNSTYLPLYEKKCEVIPIGVNLDWASSGCDSDKVNIKIPLNKKPLILFVGRLVYYKGIEYLLDSMSLVKNANLVIIGSGPLSQKLNEKIIELQLNSNVKIIPEVDEQILQDYYKFCDMLVLPSVEKSETYGIVQIEAMACGKPVICTELGTGTTFINRDGVTGIVVPPRDPKLLADAINTLLSNNELKISLGNNGRERALKEFTSQKMVQRVYALYNNLLSK
jgi:glycosyltransferase involved in cell wall biosynthesis